MKKLFLSVLPILALGLAACGGGDNGSSSTSGSGGSGASSPTSTPASEPASEPTSEPTESVTLEIYVKGSAAQCTNWLSNSPTFVVYLFHDATPIGFFDAPYQETYDEGATAYHKVELESSPEGYNAIMLRLDPAVYADAAAFEAVADTDEWSNLAWNKSADSPAVEPKKDGEEQPIEGYFVVDIANPCGA